MVSSFRSSVYHTFSKKANICLFFVIKIFLQFIHTQFTFALSLSVTLQLCSGSRDGAAPELFRYAEHITPPQNTPLTKVTGPPKDGPVTFLTKSVPKMLFVFLF